MLFVYGTPLFFRHFGLEARCSNYGNTVLVKRDSGEWWLGYVQDINGDLFFINFDSSTAGASWIHTRHIWPHDYFEGGRSVYVGQRVQVAVRSEPTGPLIFRPGRIAFKPLQKHSICWNVKWPDDPLADDNFTNCKFVHESQIVAELPPADGVCFYRNATFCYKKYVIPFEQAYLIKNLDEMSACLRSAPRPSNTLLRWADFGIRYFVQFGVDFAAFVITVGCNAKGGKDIICSSTSSEDTLKVACESLLATQPPARPEMATSTYSCHDYNTDGFGIADLPHPILVAVFLHLHARVQGRIHRVCMLWHLMLPEHLVTRNVLVDIAVEIYDTLNSLWSDTYSLTMVLDQMITKHTKTLTLADFGGRGEFEIRAHTTLEVLLAKGIKVPMIIIKNCANANGELVKNAVGSGNYECENFSKLMAVCDQLLIVNHEFTVQTFFREPALSVLSVGQPQALPEPEQRFLRPRCDDKDYRVVAINRLILHSAETSDQHVRLFLLAVNNSYPPISHFVYDKVAVIYQRWLQTLVYPEDWAAVRNFLNLFSGFHLDGSLQRWDTLDLRKLNIPALNRLTLAAIDETFKDADNDY